LSKPDKIVAGLQQKLAHSTNVTAQVYRQLAYYQNAIGLPLQARDAFKKGLERFPEDKMLRLQAAHYYADAGDYPHATEILRSHPELKTNPQIAQFHLSLLLLSQRYPEAEHFIRSDISPELSASPSMLEAQATICEAGNRLDEAAAIYARLMALDRGNARYLANCARLLGSLGQSKKALAMIQPHLKDAPPEICHLLAQVFSASGDFKSAEVYERRYLASHPANQPEAWGFLGDILLSKGQKTQARRAYRTGLSVLLGEIQSGHK
jgi:tetratricopeptide (TPR) repeat protein